MRQVSFQKGSWNGTNDLRILRCCWLEHAFVQPLLKGRLVQHSFSILGQTYIGWLGYLSPNLVHFTSSIGGLWMPQYEFYSCTMNPVHSLCFKTRRCELPSNIYDFSFCPSNIRDDTAMTKAPVFGEQKSFAEPWLSKRTRQVGDPFKTTAAWKTKTKDGASIINQYIYI